MTVAPEDSLSRIDEHEAKRNPGDFALWKRAKPGEPSWDTELGPGRPGWHIEDTAITEKFYGAQYDLHGGAVDLIFPHHEAEIAQMEKISGRSPLARYWMHTGLLRVDGAKMAKSLGNFTTIGRLREQWDRRTLRYAFLSHHYRNSMELSDELLESAQASRKRIESLYRRAAADAPSRRGWPTRCAPGARRSSPRSTRTSTPRARWLPCSAWSASSTGTSPAWERTCGTSCWRSTRCSTPLTCAVPPRAVSSKAGPPMPTRTSRS